VRHPASRAASRKSLRRDPQMVRHPAVRAVARVLTVARGGIVR
jgi:hypothetical protein